MKKKKVKKAKAVSPSCKLVVKPLGDVFGIGAGHEDFNALCAEIATFTGGSLSFVQEWFRGTSKRMGPRHIAPLQLKYRGEPYSLKNEDFYMRESFAVAGIE